METLKYDVHINFYMRIHDSKLFGGKGSIGYCRQTLKNCQNFDVTKIEATAQHVIKSKNNTLGVSPDKIEFISYQEYKDETADEEDEDHENTSSDE